MKIAVQAPSPLLREWSRRRIAGLMRWLFTMLYTSCNLSSSIEHHMSISACWSDDGVGSALSAWQVPLNQLGQICNKSWMQLIGCSSYWGGFNHMVNLRCSMLRTSLFSFAEDIGLGQHAVEGLMMCPSKIATHGLATVFITYTDSIGNWGSRNPLWCHQEKCMEGRSASLSTCTI